MSNKIIMLITTFLFGLLLDYDNGAFRYIYPFIGLLGMTSLFLLSTIQTEDIQEKTKPDHIFKVFIQSFQNSWNILKKNKLYRDFELGFMFYGICFMSSTVVITIFYDKALHLNYTSTAFYKNFYNIIAIAFLPLFGKLMGKIDIRKFAIITYVFMGLMVMFVALTEYFPIMGEWAGIKFFLMMIIAYFFYGFFSATMPLLWDIGPSFFCNKDEVTDYQSIHLTLTGIRGIFAPLVGITLYKATNFTWTFVLSFVSLLVAIWVMSRSLKKKYV